MLRKEKERSEEKACRAAQKKEIGASGARILSLERIDCSQRGSSPHDIWANIFH